MSRAARPPRLARVLAKTLLRGEMREVVLGDLDEEFARALEAAVAPPIARRRYWRQAVGSIVSSLTGREQPIQTRAFGATSDNRGRWSGAVQGLALDFRYAARVLARSPAFTLVAVASLAIGIGANTAMYNVVRALLVESLPVERPEELALAYWTRPADTKVRMTELSSDTYKDPKSGERLQSNLTYSMFTAMREAAGAATPLFGFNFIGQANVSIDGQPPRLAGGMLATYEYFPVMGLTTAIGRPFVASDDRPEAPRVVVISYGLWMRAFGGDRAAIGRTIRINGTPCEVIGVTPEGYRGLSQGGFYPPVDVTLPLSSQPDVMRRWSAMPASGPSLFTSNQFWVRAIARVPPGSSGAQERLAGALRSTFAQLPAATGPELRQITVRFLPGGRGLDSLRKDTERPLEILGFVVGVVLLIACANLAGLLLARGVARQRELAVRRALGAGRFRLVRVLMAETMLLAIAGGIAGLLIAVWTGPVVASMLTVGLGAADVDLGISWRLVGITAAVAIGAAILAGLMPALRLSGRLSADLTTRAGQAGPRLVTGRALIALQIAVSMPLLVGAGLFLRTIYNLSAVDVGFKAAGLVAFKVEPSLTGTGDTREPRDLYARVLDRVRSLPGVTSASLVENLPISGRSSSTDGRIGDKKINIRLNGVGPEFFETMGIPIVDGRSIGDADRAETPPVVVVSEPFASEYFPSQRAVGQHFYIGDSYVEIVGVVAASHYRDLRTEPPPTVFDAYAQRSFATFPGFRGFLPTATPNEMSVVLRTTAPFATMASAIPSAVKEIEPDLPVVDLKTQTNQIAESTARERMFMRLLVIFGGFAVVLACIGLHGVTSYAVARRTSEIGIRMALGAERSQVLWLILRQVLVLAVAGVALGLPIAIAAGPAIGSMLYGLAPRDLTTMAGAAIVLLTVALAAGWLPARRAARMPVLSALTRE
jgi:predicted permease